MHKGNDHFPRAIEESHKIDYASFNEGGYVSDYIRRLALRYRIVQAFGYDPDTLNKTYKDVA